MPTAGLSRGSVNDTSGRRRPNRPQAEPWSVRTALERQPGRTGRMSHSTSGRKPRQGSHTVRTSQAARRYSWISPRAPRSASLYPLHSREELGGRFLGLMADLDPKGEGDRSLPGKRRPCSGAETGRCGTRVIWRKLDCLKPNLQRMQDPIRRKAPGTGVAPCIGIGGQSMQPPGCAAMPSEGI
jgi:hypothetical protein